MNEQLTDNLLPQSDMPSLPEEGQEDAGYERRLQEIQSFIQTGSLDTVVANRQSFSKQEAATQFSPTNQAIPQPANQQAPDDGLGFWGTVGDMSKGVLAGGAAAVNETSDMVWNVADYISGDALSDDNPFHLPELEVETGWGKATKGISQFAVGMIGAGKVLKAAKLLQGAGKATAVGRGLAQGAIADFTVFDGQAERLSNLVESNPSLANPVTAFLAADPDDTQAEGKLKNTIEGMVLGVAGEALITMVKGVKAIRVARTPAEAEEAVIKAADELESLAAKSGQSADELTAQVDVVLKGDEQAVSDAAKALEEAGGKAEVHVSGLSPAEAKAVKQAAPDINEALNHASVISAPSRLQSHLPVDEMKAVVRELQLSGKNMDEVVTGITNGELLSGNTRRVLLDSPEQMEIMAEYTSRLFSQTLKGKGVEKRLEVLEASKNFTESFGGKVDPEFLEMALKDKSVMEGMTTRYIGYKLQLHSTVAEIDEVMTQIALHGDSEIRTARLTWLNHAMQELGVAVKDMTTVGARMTGLGNLSVKYADINPEAAVKLLSNNKISIADVKKQAAWLSAASKHPDKIAAILKYTRMGTFFDVSSEYVINGLLSSPKTMLVNTTTNLVKAVLMPVEKIMGGALMGDSKLVSEGLNAYAGMTRYLKESWDMAALAWKTGDNVLDAGHKVMDHASAHHAISYERIRDTIFASRIRKGEAFSPSWQLEGMDELMARSMSWLGPKLRLPSKILMATDEFFKQINARSNLYSKLTVEGSTRYGTDAAKVAEFVETGMQKAFNGDPSKIPDAIRYAQESTWTQTLKDGAYVNVGQGFSELTKACPPLRLVVPFIRTPTNLIRDFVAHTPLLAPVTKRFQDAVFRGTPEQKAIALGQLATGSMFWMSAVTLAASGKITGGYPKDPATRQAWVDNGIEPYSLRVGDTYVSFARFDPFATFFGIAADYTEYSRNWNDPERNSVAAAGMISLARNLTSKSYLTGLSDLISALGDESTDGKAMQKFLRSSTTMLVPYSSAMRLGRQLSDDSMREVRGIFDTVLNSIPVTSHMLPERRSWLTGRPLSYNTFYGEHKNDPVMDEIARLGESLRIGPPAKSMNGVPLDAEQYSRLNELHGTVKIGGLTMHERLGRLIKSKGYDVKRLRTPDMPGELSNPRTQAVEDVVRQYRQRAQDQFLKERPDVRQATEAELRKKISAKRGDVQSVQKLLTR